MVVALSATLVAVGASCNRDRTNAQADPAVPGKSPGLAVDNAAARGTLALDGTSTCDTLVRLIMAPSVQLLTVVRDSTLRDPMSDTPGWRRGCSITMKDSTDEAPMQPLEQWFTSHRWVYAPYSADGPDGSVFGYTDFHRVCVVRGSWDGGDDSDTTYVPARGYELAVMCAPSTPEDSAGYGQRQREELERQDALARPRIGGAIVCPVPSGCGIASPSVAPTSMVDVVHLMAAARARSATWPSAPPLPQVDTVARHGRAIARLIVGMLPTDSSTAADENARAEQQLELALCAIYGVNPEAGKTVRGAHAGWVANRAVRQFWRDRVRSGS